MTISINQLLRGEGLGYSYEGGAMQFDSDAKNKTYIDLFTKSENSENWRIEAPKWIVLSKGEGCVNAEERIVVSCDFENLDSSTTGVLKIYNDDNLTGEINVTATVKNIELEEKSYIEANGKVVLEAEHYSQAIEGLDGSYWALWENGGRSGDCMTALPFDLKRSDNGDIKTSARLKYRVYFTSMGTFSGKFYRIPTLNEGANDDGTSRSCRTGIGIDDSEPYLLKRNSTTGGTWKSNIMHMVEPIEFTITVKSPGWHDVYVYRSDSGIIFNRIVIETVSGSVKESLLGPEESPNNIFDVHYEIASLPCEITDFQQ